MKEYKYVSTITEQELKTIVEMYTAGIGATTIARTLGNKRSELFVVYNLKKQGIPIRRVSEGKYRKYTLNQNYFDQIDTHEKAYWLGFLFADGYNHETRGEVKLCLKKDDGPHIQAFLTAIGSNQPLKIHACNLKSNSTQVVICNKSFSRRLAELGCFQAKSFNIRFPKIEDQFAVSFMLGYFDGDGSICDYGGSTFTITSCYDFCLDYQERLIAKADVTKTKLYDKYKGTRAIREHAWGLHYGGRGNTRKIFNFLYSSPVTCYLQRKRAVFDKILTEPDLEEVEQTETTQLTA